MKKKIFYLVIVPAALVTLVIPAIIFEKVGHFCEDACDATQKTIESVGKRARVWAGIEEPDDWKILKDKEDDR